MALTVDFTTGVGSNEPWATSPVMVLRKQEVVLNADVVSGSLTSTDTYQAIDIPAGTFVLGAWFDVVTADAAGNSGTVSLGDTASGVAAWVAAATVAAVVLHVPAGSTHHLTAGKYYTSADVLKLTVATGILSATTKFMVYALCVDLE